MTQNTQHTTVTIFGKTLEFVCPAGTEHELRDAASYLSNEMYKIRENSKVIESHKITLLAALNITHQLLQLSNKTKSSSDSTKQRINSLIKQANTVLSDEHQTA